ncbi:hypothetical protein EDC94DRAFT_617434 [Helicostylum pulchrum]|nr:hypothetical protein EDC94DRAFT_617434 [Helicostylum pulchrum]
MRIPILFILTLTLTVKSLPIFETANDYDRYGNQCPLFPLYNVACPILCVKNHDFCPPSLAPVCPIGQQFCVDGTCQTLCDSSIPNVCMCNQPSSTDFLPCAKNQLINITHFNPGLKEIQTRELCASAANIPNMTPIGLWGFDNATIHNLLWAQCPPVPPAHFTFKEPIWSAVWAISAAEAFILFSWHIYKYIAELKYKKNLKSSSLLSTKATHSDSSVVEKIKTVQHVDHVSNNNIENEKETKTLESSLFLQDAEQLGFRGFKRDYFGLLSFGSVIIVTFLFMVFLGCIVGDYYGKLDGGVLNVYLSSDSSSKIFCAVWHISAAWFATVLIFRNRIQNYFRIESYPHVCPFIQIERKQDELVFLQDDNKWISKFREIERTVIERLGMNIIVETCPVHLTSNNLRYFEFQCMRYIYNTEKRRFEPYLFDLGSTNRELKSLSEGIKTSEAIYRKELLGPNIIPVYVPSIPWAIIQEFSSFLYLYQMMCMWVWYYFQYYPMGLVQTGIILTSAFIRVYLRLKAERRIKSMAEYTSKIHVYRDCVWKEDISSAGLVPGDVFEIDEHSQVPCDCVLLSGTVVVNESALTGEAMPIRKFPLPDDDNVYDIDGVGKSNTLYAGTLISQVIPAIDQSEKRVYAVVVRTGISSEKGMLIHKILFPSPVSFIFDQHIKIAICILLIWGGITFGLTLYLMGRGNITSWYYGIFIISQIFSPLLPAAFTINQSVCAARLRKKQIICIDLARINLAGKVRIFCFDKTGTLTREGLEFFGSVAATQNQFQERIQDPLSMDPTLAMGIATCHAVTKVGDQLIGNPVDIESFNAMHWEIISPVSPDYLDSLMPPTGFKHTTYPVHVIRRCEFIHAHASQSVVILDPTDNHVHVFLKGSFEKVKLLSTTGSIPANYDLVSSDYAQQGCYVLALAHRDIGEIEKDVTIEQVKNMSRVELEVGCNFVGFVLFRNMLKEDTADAISQLKEGDIRTVMITGDTALTGIYIARQCGMIDPGQDIFLGDLVHNQMVWRNINTGNEINDINTVLNEDTCPDYKKRIELALTGCAFEFLVTQNLIRPYLLYTRVFARMTPNDKVKCVQLHMEKGVTAMCGDGGNDCGALRAAHVGMALSEAEASMVSPFSTGKRTIMQCVELLKQGRAALATSFANYKFLILYGEIMCAWELTMFYFSVIAPQSIWITIDGFITTSMTFAITQASPANRLAPARPTAKPLGLYTLASCCGVIFINFLFAITSIVWLFQQDWFICNEFDSTSIDTAKWWLLGDNYESEIISLVVLFQFFNSAAIVNFGTSFRQSWWRNYILVFFYCCFFVHVSFLILADPNPYSCIFRINCGSSEILVELGYPKPNWDIPIYNSPFGHNVLPKYFRWELWGFVIGNSIINIIWERIVLLCIVKKWAIKSGRANKEGKVVMKL